MIPHDSDPDRAWREAFKCDAGVYVAPGLPCAHCGALDEPCGLDVHLRDVAADVRRRAPAHGGEAA